MLIKETGISNGIVRVDYRVHNYCRQCGIKTSKDIIRCPLCNYQIRVTAHNKLSKFPESYKQETKIVRY